MKRAGWNGVVIAEADDIVMVEASLKKECFTPSETHTQCPWTGDPSRQRLLTAARTRPRK